MYLKAPTFWLDEARVALSLRDPSPLRIYSRLQGGVYFPRTYLLSIATLRELVGYQIWSLRLVPLLCFVAGTIFWGRLLAKRALSSLPASLLAGGLLLGSVYWLEQAIQLKQYSFDVMLSLIPFLVGDAFFERTLAEGRSRGRLVLLAVPCALSYTYPFAIAARIGGWYLHKFKHKESGLNTWSVVVMAGFTAIGLLIILATDHQFNLRDRASYLSYWNECLVRTRFSQGLLSGLRLVGDFYWGWYPGRLMPIVLAVVAPLQILGCYSVAMRWKERQATTADSLWGSRTLGSLVLLGGVVLASGLFSYPICAGRLVLFTQIHTQILAVEGALFVLESTRLRKTRAFVYIGIAIVIPFSVLRYIRLQQNGPPENLRPVMALIKPEVSNHVWIHPCSRAQVESLPDPLPVQYVSADTRGRFPEPGERVWVLWTHLGEESCRRSLEETRARSVKWQVIHEGFGRGLALAEF